MNVKQFHAEAVKLFPGDILVTERFDLLADALGMSSSGIRKIWYENHAVPEPVAKLMLLLIQRQQAGMPSVIPETAYPA